MGNCFERRRVRKDKYECVTSGQQGGVTSDCWTPAQYQASYLNTAMQRDGGVCVCVHVGAQRCYMICSSSQGCCTIY